MIKERSPPLIDVFVVCVVSRSKEEAGSYSCNNNDLARVVVSTSAHHHNSDDARGLHGDRWTVKVGATKITAFYQFNKII